MLKSVGACLRCLQICLRPQGILRSVDHTTFSRLRTWNFSRVARYSNSTMLEVCEINPDGQLVQKHFSRADFLKELEGVGFHLRNMHALDSGSRNQGAVLLPQPDYYIFNMEFVKAVCLSDRCLLLDANKPKVKAFIDSFQRDCHISSSTPFELRFLDSALDAVVMSLDQQLCRLTPVVNTVLDQLVSIHR